MAHHAKQKTGTLILLGLAALALLLILFKRKATTATPGQGGAAGSAAGNIFSGLTGLFGAFTNGASAPAASNVGNTVGTVVDLPVPGNYQLPTTLGIGLPGAPLSEDPSLPAVVAGGGGSFGSELSTGSGADTNATAPGAATPDNVATGYVFSPAALG